MRYPTIPFIIILIGFITTLFGVYVAVKNQSIKRVHGTVLGIGFSVIWIIAIYFTIEPYFRKR